ncbi:MAG: 16S rRNA (guanine(527)-N(7))-methyltransferase RsmG [Spirochaetaceae bacterium]
MGGAPGSGGAGAAGGYLEATLEALDIDASAGQRDALRRYLGELELWNRKRDLVKAEGAALITRHLADSLAALPIVRRELAHANGGTLTDLGSGGGFPGIPLSVFLPETAVVLVERSLGKCAFLRSAAAVAGLGHVRVVNADFRDLAAGTTGATAATAAPAVITFRALSEIDRAFAGVLARLAGPGGSIVAYKGRRARAEPEAEAGRAVFDEVELIPLEVPGPAEERTLLVFRLSAESA